MRQEILEILYETNEELELYNGMDMIEDMVIDSHDIFNIVVELEEHFKIEISPELIVPDNFKNVDTIMKMVELIQNI